jgi:hypothetical protein
MKIPKSLIIGALLGYVSAVDLEKHHHQHSFVQMHHHHPRNIGVRFIQTEDEGEPPKSPADAAA